MDSRLEFVGFPSDYISMKKKLLLGEHIEKRLAGCEDNTHFIGTQRPPPPQK